MPIIVHKTNQSPPARLALVVADILGLKIETREVNLKEKEQFDPKFVEKNPLHAVPLLEDGDFILADSHAIAIYLITKYGGDKAAELYPDDVQQRAIVHQRLFLDASVLFPRLVTIFKAIASEGASRVDEKKAADVEEAYGFLDKYLERSPYLAGERLTIADICCVLTVSSLNFMVPINAKYTKLLQWWDKLKTLSWYSKLNEPGLKEFCDHLSYLLKKNAE